jgi:hypothetical protein
VTLGLQLVLHSLSSEVASAAAAAVAVRTAVASSFGLSQPNSALLGQVVPFGIRRSLACQSFVAEAEAVQKRFAGHFEELREAGVEVEASENFDSAETGVQQVFDGLYFAATVVAVYSLVAEFPIEDFA